MEQMLGLSNITAFLATGALAVLVSVLFSKDTEKAPHVPSQSAVLITGGGRGIGRSIANHLLQQGYVVMVTVRKERDYDALEKETDILPVLLDVTNDSQVAPAVERVQKILNDKQIELVGVVNNAGKHEKMLLVFVVGK